MRCLKIPVLFFFFAFSMGNRPTSELQIPTKYFPNREKKSRRFSRNYVDSFSKVKRRYDRKSATSHMEIRWFALWTYCHNKEKLPLNILMFPLRNFDFSVRCLNTFHAFIKKCRSRESSKIRNIAEKWFLGSMFSYFFSRVEKLISSQGSRLR